MSHDRARRAATRARSHGHADMTAPAEAEELVTPVQEPERLLSMFVISDLHVVGADTADHKHESFCNNIDPDGRLRTPFNRLDALIDLHGLTADVVVCCGDLTNRAGRDGFIHGWQELERLTRKLKADTLLLTPGNHDLDVRNIHGTGDPRVCLNSSPVLTKSATDAASVLSSLFPPKPPTRGIPNPPRASIQSRPAQSQARSRPRRGGQHGGWCGWSHSPSGPGTEGWLTTSLNASAVWQNCAAP